MCAYPIRMLPAILLSLFFATLSGCGGNTTGADNTTASDNSISLSGAVFKGPIDNAQLSVVAQDGSILAGGASTNGAFSISDISLPSEQSVIFLESRNGQYTDEATGTLVSPGSNGLMAAFTTDELKTIAQNNDVIAMTPETTIVAQLVKTYLASGKTPLQAITDARALVQSQLLDGTSPATGVQGDSLLLTGNLSATSPSDSSQALARNRAAGFSFDAQAKNLSPDQVFDLINSTIEDLKDGNLDGKDATGLPLTLLDKDSNAVDLSKVNRKTGYALARTRQLDKLIERVGNGMASSSETAELQQMGIDTGFFSQLATENAAAKAQTAINLAATNLPAFNFLPVLNDEDGDTTNNAATYTLNALANIDVTINAPGTSWITPMMRYNNNQLPPVIIASRGDTMTLNLVNYLNEPTTIHWHGFKIPGDQDGGPDFPVAAGSSKQYSFTLQQPAASLWFHPHPDMLTGKQVYSGLAGVFLIKDAVSDQLESNNALPFGQYDIPVLIQDRRFAAQDRGKRQLLYKDQPWDSMGMVGSDILVNGSVLPKLDVDTHHYRFRLYNTSNARSYLFALSDGSSFTVVATDGGLLPQPVTVTELMLGAAERAEIVIDFGNYNVGDKVMLVSKAFSASPMMAMGNMTSGMGGMGSGAMMPGGGMNPSGIAINGRYADIMRFDVTNQVSDRINLYTSLPAAAEINSRLTENDAGNSRNFVLGMGMSGSGGMSGISYLINGKSFDINRVDEVIDIASNDTEIWSIQNLTPMAHPFHAHAIQWQVLDRNGVAASGTDLGWKDTVLVQPGETVRIIGRFDPAVNTGKYMYHCHILEHEDAGMMGTFQIQ